MVSLEGLGYFFHRASKIDSHMSTRVSSEQASLTASLTSPSSNFPETLVPCEFAEFTSGNYLFLGHNSIFCQKGVSLLSLAVGVSASSPFLAVECQPPLFF